MYGQISEDEYGGTFSAQSEELSGWTVEADDVSARLSNGPVENGCDVTETRCAYCGETDPDPDDLCMSPESEDDRHSPEQWTPPLSWANSARIEADPDGDTLTVTISVGDPRGAFAMRVERMRYINDDGEDVEELRLSVPHPDDSLPHMTLTPLASPGYYRIS